MENLTVEEALEQLLCHTKEIQETEQVSLLLARGRILANDERAKFDNPPFDRSPIDGYACHFEDLKDAKKESPVCLKVVEEVDAGQYSNREVKSGEAIRIMTGAAVPAGCDCCVRQEDTDYGEDTVKIFKSHKKWENYCFQGEDFKKDTVLLKKGTKIGFVETGILASMGAAEVCVKRKVKAAVLTTGDEVMTPGQALLPGKIYNSNQSLLAARLMDFDVELVQIDTIQDNPQDMAEAIKRIAKQVDLIVTTGAVSVGKKDIMHEALRMIGAERIFWRVLMKPGMPTLFSMYQETPIVSLSGNPFGVAVTVDVLIRPMLHKMTQDETLAIVHKKCKLKNEFSKKIKGRRYVRAFADETGVTIPCGLHSNGVLATMAGCNCLIDMQEDKPGIHVGEDAEVLLL